MRHTTLLFVCSILFTPILYAQRILPIHPSENIGSGIFAVAQYDGYLYLGGYFQEINGQACSNLIGWDGGQYEQAPGAFSWPNQIVRDLLVYDGRLIAAGNEPGLGHVAAWDGSAWSAMGQGFSARAWALVIHDGSLLAGGESQEVKRWNGSTWLPVGDTFNGDVYALEVHAGVLYAGGAFTATQGGTPLPGGLAQWNGSAWEAVAGGLNGTVWALRTDPEGLLIGGDFSAAADGTGTFHNWTILGSTGFQQVPSDPTLPAVRGFHRFPYGRLGVGASWSIHGGSGASLIIEGASTKRLDGFGIRAGRMMDGELVLFGSGGLMLHRIVKLMGRYDDGMPAVNAALNDVSAHIDPSPRAFSRSYGWGYEVPAGGGAHSIFSSNPILLAYSDGVRNVSIPTNDQVGLPYPGLHPWAGPQAANMDDVFYERYHQVWQIDREQVQHHIANWSNPEYEAPLAIRSWPGNGDQNNGEPEQLAPFMDLNDNGVYEPLYGEYPVFRGDRCVYTISHTVQDSYEGDPPLHMDQHSFYHVFDAELGSALHHTVFVHYQFINRSTQVYDQLRFGQFADMDIGCPNDDLVGCDSTRNMFFTYNANNTDPSCGTIVGYGDQPPAQGIKFLDHTMRSHWALNAYPSFSPTVADMMYGLMGGEPYSMNGWPDDFLFPGGEYMDEQSIWQPERLSVAATGPFTLAPGDTLCIDLAFIFARAPSGGAYASVETLEQRADSVQAFYDSLALDCRSIPVMVGVGEVHAQQPLQLFPNPTADAVTIVAGDGLGRITLMDMQGRILRTVNTTSDRHTLDMSAHPAGLYVVAVMNPRGKRMARLVKQ